MYTGLKDVGHVCEGRLKRFRDRHRHKVLVVAGRRPKPIPESYTQQHGHSATSPRTAPPNTTNKQQASRHTHTQTGDPEFEHLAADDVIFKFFWGLYTILPDIHTQLTVFGPGNSAIAGKKNVKVPNPEAEARFRQKRSFDSRNPEA